MNRKAIIALVIAIVVVAGVITTFALKTRASHEHHEEGVTYYCPMHPTVTSDKPGSCPICGMKLVRKTDSRKADLATQALADHGALDATAPVVLSAGERALANVRTEAATMMAFSTPIVTTGRVTYDERRLALITSYTSGRIERLFAKVAGDFVRRGDAVAAIYSPDLFATQQEYLLALRNRVAMQRSGFSDARTSADDLVASTQRRLELFGMTPAQIRRLAEAGQPMHTTTIVSPVSGVVLRKEVVEQQYVAQGQPLFQIADLSHVWVEANVHEQDLRAVAPGQRVSITSSGLPGVTLRGNVAAILPAITGDTRTATIRVELPNSGLKLRPDMFVNVSIDSTAPAPRLTVPVTAVVDRGQRKLVWVEKTAGTFEPRTVTTGVRSSDRVEIVTGLQAGERVVVSGGFLIDADAQLEAAMKHTM